MTTNPTLSLSIFEDVPPDLLSQIVPSLEMQYSDGQKLITAGERHRLIILLEGDVRVENRGQFLARRGPGEILGEQAFLCGEPHSADVVALGWVRALALPEPLALQLLRDPAFLRNVTRGLSAKPRSATGIRTTDSIRSERMFAQLRLHTSEHVTQELLRSGQDFGQPRHIDATILFSDIRSFTALSEG
ncbi:MAG: cyclic nucleotide-binding domain-containing protein, partial [Proteobacteria bacterium]